MEGKIEQPEPNRDEQSEKLIDFLHKIKAEQAFNSEENKINFLKNLTFEEFKDWLERVNGILRNKQLADREMDGANMIIGGHAGVDHVFPLFEDKDSLLKKAFDTVQKTDNIQDIALLLSTAITAIHPFKDGNGRTSRLTYTLFSQNYEGTIDQDEHLKEIVGEEGRQKIDTSSMLLDHHIGFELFQEAVLDLNITRNCFPRWQDVRDLNPNLSEEDFKLLLELDKDGFDESLSIYKYLKGKGTIEKYERPILNDENTRVVRIIVDLEKLMPDLTADDVKGIMQQYWNLKKVRVEKIIDVFASPERHLLSNDEKTKEEKDKAVTLKDKFKQQVLSTMG